MGGFLEDLGGVGRIWKDFGGSEGGEEMVYKILKDFEDLGGVGRIWKDLGGFEDSGL